MGRYHHDCKCKHRCKNRCKDGCGSKGTRSQEEPMLTGDSAFTKGDWKTESLITVAECYNGTFNYNLVKFGYQPIGIFDGLGAVKLSDRTVRMYANHEAYAADGTVYSLENGVELTGARIDAWDLTKKCVNVKEGKVAYKTIIDREGLEVTDPDQINKGREDSVIQSINDGAFWFYLGGFTRFCSGGSVNQGQYGFSNTTYIAGEEIPQGHVTVTDTCNETNYIVPMLGQYLAEQARPIENFGSNKVVILISDDAYFLSGIGVPLWLYVGEVGVKPPVGASYNPPDYLVRNGLGYGKLFAWVPDNPAYVNGGDFKGTNNVASGKFVAVNHYDPSKEGVAPYDNLGFLPNSTFDEYFIDDIPGPLTQAGLDAGCFQFFNVEDSHADPKNPSEVVFATTGGFDTPVPYGRVYTIKLETSVADELQKNVEDITELEAYLRILHDPEDGGGGQVSNPDDAIRSPDNLTWAYDGYIYVQEDLSSSEMCSTNGIPNSVWKINPHTAAIERILVMDRSAVPKNQIDVDPEDCSGWESSGVIDVSHLFCNPEKRTMLLLDVQAHTIYEPEPPFAFIELIEGSQVLLAVGPKCPDLGEPRSLRRECHCCVDNNFAVRRVPVENGEILALQAGSELSQEEKIQRKLSKYLRNDKRCDELVATILEKIGEEQ